MKLILIYIPIRILLIGCAANSMDNSNNTIIITDVITDKETEIVKEIGGNELFLEDLEFCDSLINGLTGIEKYVVKKDYNILSAVLDFNKDTVNSNKVNEVILKRDGHLKKYNITVLDKNNGYMVYAPMGGDLSYTATFWNLKNGSKLICTEEFGCGPACWSDLSFENYIDGIYVKVENKTLIPEFETLQNSLIPEFDDLDIETSDYLEFQYSLPQNGKDILFCLDEDCITLEWKNEKFIIKQ